ncbi:MAG TPA: CheR family methyltransferase [Burkholderiales bacterium]|nr:CheR family methyltransferase [Burkholderiales bacterium]
MSSFVPTQAPVIDQVGAEREFEFAARDFQRVRKLIYSRAGISLNDTKENMVYSRLARRLRVLRRNDFGAYLDWLESTPDAVEWQEFVNALTTNLTSFFREEHHFPLLADLLRRRRHQPELAIWCSACSTGEEAYSIAMTAYDALPGMASRVRILASDIDTNVLDTARKGVYDEERIERLEAGLKRRHFLRGRGVHDGRVRVKPELQQMLSFQRLNLLDARWNLQGSFDAIFCRNVMIYFDKPTQLQILEKFSPLLKPGGLLFVGHSENFHHAKELFVLRGKTVYQRTSDERQ